MSVKKIVKSEVEANGFAPASRLWIRAKDGVRQVIELEKSKRGEYYFVNVAVFLEEVEQSARINKASDCHVEVRLEHLIPQEFRRPLFSALDEEVTITDEDRERIIQQAMPAAFAFLDRYSVKASILELARLPKLERPSGVTVWWPLLEFVGHKRTSPFDADYDPRWRP